MPSVPGSAKPLPREQTALRQWCGNCQRATPNVIIEGRTFCARCQPQGFDTPCDDEED